MNSRVLDTRYAKFILALIGAAASVVVTFTTSGQAHEIALTVIAVMTAFGVYVVPNAPAQGVRSVPNDRRV